MYLPEIPETIKPYIKEIASKLSDGRAAVMIGAGFSKNAIKSDPNSREFPSWNELGDVLYEKIHGEKPSSNDRYLSILKLADEVDATFGRAVLNEMLIEYIPDKDHFPSELHKKLLNLNWCDVFTTNYDTLLERSCEFVVSRRFDIVVNQEDLVYSKQPRIVKLHGSFPSERPLIVSEKDYRQYPKKFAPFINTVQQALLENTLCLIGFSADDPNFLQWIGWIHDNLGAENSPKIFMIGLFNFSEVQKRHLEMKNIILVNLDAYENNNGDHSKALHSFFDHLLNSQQDDNLNWPTGLSKFETRDDDQLKEQISNWRQTRKAYPNWVVLSEKKREALWILTSFTEIKNVLNAELIVDLEFCYELNWRLERCMCPLIDDLEPTFRVVFNKYNFFDLPESNGKSIKDFNLSNLEGIHLKQKWIELGIALLRSYREKGNLPMWEELNDLLVKFVDTFNPDVLARFKFERAMFSIYSHNYIQLVKNLESWPYNESLPFWEAKRAGLLIEIGQYKEAVRILEKSLFYVRKQQNLHFTVNDYSWVSQEAYIMYLLSYVQFNANPIIEINDPQQFRKRWSELVKYKCDPWSERRLFELVLKSEYIPWSNKLTKESFDIGFENQQFHSSGNSEVLKAYSFVRFLEEISFPLNLRHSNIKIDLMAGALKRIFDYSPYLVISLISRYNNVDIVDKVLTRNQIAKLDIENIDLLINNHLNVFNEVLPDLELRKTAESFVARMPEILSRFCVRCSPESRIKIYKFICEVYKNGISTKNMSHLLRRISNASNEETRYRVIPDFLNIPLERIDSFNFPDPFHYLNVFYYKPEVDKINIPEWQIIKLIEESIFGLDNRDKATYRLYTLQEIGLLNDEQIEKLKRTVWSCVDENGFPLGVSYNKRYILKSVFNKDLDVKEIFKKYLFTQAFVNDQPNTLSIQEGRNRLISEIIWFSKTRDNIEGITWTLNELIEIVEKLISWWNIDKQKIKKSKESEEEMDFIAYSGSSELQRRFKDILDVIIKIVPIEKTTLEHWIFC